MNDDERKEIIKNLGISNQIKEFGVSFLGRGRYLDGVKCLVDASNSGNVDATCELLKFLDTSDARSIWRELKDLFGRTIEEEMERLTALAAYQGDDESIVYLASKKK